MMQSALTGIIDTYLLFMVNPIIYKHWMVYKHLCIRFWRFFGKCMKWFGSIRFGLILVLVRLVRGVKRIWGWNWKVGGQSHGSKPSGLEHVNASKLEPVSQGPLHLRLHLVPQLMSFESLMVPYNQFPNFPSLSLILIINNIHQLPLISSLAFIFRIKAS